MKLMNSKLHRALWGKAEPSRTQKVALFLNVCFGLIALCLPLLPSSFIAPILLGGAGVSFTTFFLDRHGKAR